MVAVNAAGLVPVADFWEWQVRGLCRALSPDLFFHPDHERGPARRRRAQQAKEVCTFCPVLAQCRDHALKVDEPYGVWGGMSEEERAQISHGGRRH